MSDATDPGDPGHDAYLAEGNARQARKRVAADALIRDHQGQLLLVRPTYKAGWDLPGGMSEGNEEPLITVYRELDEELGLGDVGIQGLLCLDWVAPHGPWDDLLAFVFDGGELSATQIEQLAPRDAELSGYGFFEAGEALHMLPARQSRRADQALRALSDGIVRYLRNGIPAWPVPGGSERQSPADGAEDSERAVCEFLPYI
ncbi:NUDIX domain-containing protein [Streptomyces sp. NPDC058001]|uniref:NUDIX domain-containing protein n=1 Tax=Streptomyces sp. NPDC058001 TaxID=3346300 RepID=UPI0036E27811